jgi:hypothetical protein
VGFFLSFFLSFREEGRKVERICAGSNPFLKRGKNTQKRRKRRGIRCGEGRRQGSCYALVPPLCNRRHNFCNLLLLDLLLPWCDGSKPRQLWGLTAVVVSRFFFSSVSFLFCGHKPRMCFVLPNVLSTYTHQPHAPLNLCSCDLLNGSLCSCCSFGL